MIDPELERCRDALIRMEQRARFLTRALMIMCAAIILLGVGGLASQCQSSPPSAAQRELPPWPDRIYGLPCGGAAACGNN